MKPLSALDRGVPQVMGILNVTPDSFSDGGLFFSGSKLLLDRCTARAEEMVRQGASLVDVGGESARPGAATVSVQEEMDRVLPVIEALRGVDAVVSLDSSTPRVMEAASRLGIGLINDVRALRREGAMAVAAKSGLPVCLMHMQGEPDSMQERPEYRDVVQEVAQFLQGRMEACVAAGIDRSRLLLDPGFGFGKRVEHNVALLAGLNGLGELGQPLLVGLSRKSMLVHLLGERTMAERLAGSLALAVLAVERGAWIVRAHDVRETVDAIRVASVVALNTNRGR